MKIVHGDIIELAKKGDFDLIVHGCNCFKTMGKGFALKIKNEFPPAFEADLKTDYGDRTKMGGYSKALIDCRGHKLVVINGYIQYGFGNSRRHVQYYAVESVFKKIKAEFSGLKIGYPLIGAGLGGGNWSVIKTKIDAILMGENHTLVIYP